MRKSLVLLVVLALAASAALAQIVSGSISGTVKDPAGLAVSDGALDRPVAEVGREAHGIEVLVEEPLAAVAEALSSELQRDGRPAHPVGDDMDRLYPAVPGRRSAGAGPDHPGRPLDRRRPRLLAPRRDHLLLRRSPPGRHHRAGGVERREQIEHLVHDLRRARVRTVDLVDREQARD